MASYMWPPTNGGSGIPIYPSVAAFPLVGNVIGDAAIDASNIGNIYEWNGSSWILTASSTAVLSVGAFGSSPNANGASVSAGVLTLQPADGTHPGGVSITTQTFAGSKTFSSAPTFSTIASSSVLFAGTSGLVSADTGLIWDNTNKRLGIGQAGSTPSASLDVHISTSNNVIQANNVGTQGSTAGATIAAISDPGAAIASGSRLGQYTLGGSFDNSHTLVNSLAVQGFATEDWSSTARGSKLGFYTTQNTTTGLNLVLTLDQDKSATFVSTVTGTQLISTIATGTAPLVVSSTTQVANLNAATAGSATSATNATNVGTTQVSNNASYFPLMVASSTNGNQPCDLGTGLTFNPSTNNLSTTTFTGALSGNATTATTATNATNVATTQVSNSASYFPLMVSSSTNGNHPCDLGTGLTFNPSTNTLSTTTFVGALTGTASGNVTSVTFTGDGTVLSSTPSSAVTSSGTLTASLNTQTARTFLTGPLSGSAAAPTFKALTTPTRQTFTSTGTTSGYLFTISTSTTCAVGDTYTNNSNTYTVVTALSAQSGQVLFMSGASAPLSSGTLTRATGSGTASVTFSANVALASYTPQSNPPPLYCKIRLIGAGAGGGGGGASGGSAGGVGTSTAFNLGLLVAGGGAGGDKGSSSSQGGQGGTAIIGSGTIGQGFPGSYGQTGGGSNGTTAELGPGGSGGASPFGGNGCGGLSTGTASTAGATNTGSGGGGGGFGSLTSAGGGGGGGSGAYIDAVISPSGTCYYCIGTGGSAGTAGTSSGAGAAGAAGIIIIDEFYQ
jgi:hypothetical protein